jgi:hypothetical protein
LSVQLIAYLLVIGLLVLAVFQVAIALGAPVGRASWGGRNPGRLPQNLRVASAVSVAVYLVAVLIVLDRAAMPVIDLPEAVSRIGAWVLVALLAVGTLVNLASSSPYERFGWAPFAAVLAMLALLLALS